MRRELLIAAVLTMGTVTSCSGDTSGVPVATAPSAGSVPVPSDASASPSPSEGGDAAPLDTLAGSSGGDSPELVAGVGPTVPVAGGTLPSVVTDAITDGGGELIDPGSWDARFETYSLPRIDGPGVKLAGASITVSAIDGGWEREDALQWLYMDTEPLSVRLDDLALAAGLEGVDVQVDESVVQGADCVTRSYDTGAVVWSLEGCEYPVYPGMRATAVIRQVSGTGVEPPVVDPSLVQVMAAIDATLMETSIEFGAPEAGVATVSTTAVLVYPGFERAPIVEALEAGPLAGWELLPGDISDVFLAGGNRWTVSDTGAVTLNGSTRVVW